jgi:glutamate dehydrogenase (NAD(P)+)
VAVSDSSGAIYRHDGLDIRALIAHKLETGSVKDFAGSKKIDQDSVFTLPVDILVPCAREGSIHAGNAAKVEARIIAEGANHPVTREADLILRQDGRTVIPDVLANAGGVTVSYYEWVQDFNNFYWSLDEINANLEKHIARALNEIYAVAEEKKIDLRTAAYVLAISRINESTNLRGLYP